MKLDFDQNEASFGVEQSFVPENGKI